MIGRSTLAATGRQLPRASMMVNTTHRLDRCAVPSYTVLFVGDGYRVM